MIVPFLGTDSELESLSARLSRLAYGDGDELIVVDNRQDPVRTPAFARNRGAADASGEWLLFIDADTEPDPGLIEAYFDPLPAERTAILAGTVEDRAANQGLVARHSVARAQMSQTATLERGGMPYAQSSNCAILASAFHAVGGFDSSARAGEDAELCFRLLRAGYELEQRPLARAGHQSRATLRAWLEQLVLHGAGAAWVEARWPGEFQPPGPRKLGARLGHDALAALRAGARGDWQASAFAWLDLLGALAFELGRLLPNTRGKPPAGGA